MAFLARPNHRAGAALFRKRALYFTVLLSRCACCGAGCDKTKLVDAVKIYDADKDEQKRAPTHCADKKKAGHCAATCAAGSENHNFLNQMSNNLI